MTSYCNNLKWVHTHAVQAIDHCRASNLTVSPIDHEGRAYQSTECVKLVSSENLQKHWHQAQICLGCGQGCFRSISSGSQFCFGGDLEIWLPFLLFHTYIYVYTTAGRIWLPNCVLLKPLVRARMGAKTNTGCRLSNYIKCV